MDSQYHDTILVDNVESNPRHSLGLIDTKELVDLHSATYSIFQILLHHMRKVS